MNIAAANRTNETNTADEWDWEAECKNRQDRGRSRWRRQHRRCAEGGVDNIAGGRDFMEEVAIGVVAVRDLVLASS